jgi:small subunit ribosomal protein S14
MTRKALLGRQEKRLKLSEKYAELRKELKARGDYSALHQLPRNASPTRLRNRCAITGRGRGYIRRFGISRILFRQKALLGEIPGVKKISW